MSDKPSKGFSPRLQDMFKDVPQVDRSSAVAGFEILTQRIRRLEQERDQLQEDNEELLAFIASVEHESECSADGGCVCGLLDLLDKHKEPKT